MGERALSAFRENRAIGELIRGKDKKREAGRGE